MKNSTALFESYLEVYNDCHVDEKWYKAGDPKYKVNRHGDKVGGGKDRRTSLEPELRKASPFDPEFTRRRLRVNDKKIDPYYEGSRKKRKANREAAGGKTYSEEYDIFDIIRDYLLDEGYAETLEAANAIMVNMSEEWREDILDEAKFERLRFGKNKKAGIDYSGNKSHNRDARHGYIDYSQDYHHAPPPSDTERRIKDHKARRGVKGSRPGNSDHDRKPGLYVKAMNDKADEKARAEKAKARAEARSKARRGVKKSRS